MSFLPISEENKEAPVGQTTNAPQTTTPPQTSGSVGSGTEAPKGSSQGSSTQFGSSASKLGDYLSANAPQITQQADTLVGNLNQQYQNVNKGITDAAKQFGDQVQGGYAAYQPGVIDQALQNPTGFAADPNNVQAFQGQYNDTYTGPLSFEGTSPYSDIQNQVGQAVQQGNLLGTTAGLQSYLQGQGTNPSRAAATLDTLLLQGDPAAQAKIQNAAGQMANLPGQFQTATQNANQSILDAQNAAQTANAYAQNNFNPFVQNFGQTLANQLSAAQGTYTNQVGNQNAIQGILNNNGTISPELAAIINIDPTAYKNLINEVNQYSGVYGSSPVGSLGNYLTLGSAGQGGPPTISTASTANDFAMAQALSQLLGQGYQNPLNPADIGLAGTANQGFKPGSFDLSTAQKDVTNKFSADDLAYLLGTHAGPTDALRQAAQVAGQPQGIYSQTYNPAIQAAAAQELPYIQKFGAGYYPEVNQRWVDTLNRLASNPY